jgi:hypothetical protein
VFEAKQVSDADSLTKNRPVTKVFRLKNDKPSLLFFMEVISSQPAAGADLQKFDLSQPIFLLYFRQIHDPFVHLPTVTIRAPLDYKQL